MNKTTESTNISSTQTESTKPANNNDQKNTGKQENQKEYCIGGYHPIKIGDLLSDRYEVVRKIGYGGFSTVWHCRDLKSTADVAVKVVKSKAEVSAKQEIICHKIVSNNNLFIKLFDNFQVTGVNGVHQCLVTELLGGTLFDLIRQANGRIPIQNVKIIAKQVLEGLDYLHTKCKIIHCDIKVENILFCIEDRLKVKIADYGCVRSVNRHSDKLIQTPEYRCPEVILGCGYGPSADIWSTACVLFKIATANRLFSPAAGDGYCLAERHLALMMQALGRFPKRIILKGKRGMEFFSEDGMLRNVAPLEWYNLYRRLRDHFDRNSAAEFRDFLIPMLEYDPDWRASANQCLRHEWLN